MNPQSQRRTNPTFSKLCLCPSDFRYFRHFRRFRGSEDFAVFAKTAPFFRKGRTWAIAVRRGSCESLFLLNSGRFSLENSKFSSELWFAKNGLNRYAQVLSSLIFGTGQRHGLPHVRDSRCSVLPIPGYPYDQHDPI